MAQYKPGDKVCVRSDLDVGVEYCMASRIRGVFAVPPMLKYAGCLVTIRRFNHTGCYYIEEDDGFWNWTDEMLCDSDELPQCYKSFYEGGF